MAHETEHGGHEAHACPFWILLAVFVALLVLTVVTVGTAIYVDLGEYNLLLAMAIALLKGSLVCLFFMHLWWDSLFNSTALLAGLAFLALFIGLTLLDASEYKPEQAPLQTILTVETVGKYAPPSHHGEHAGHEEHAPAAANPAAEPAAKPAAEEGH